MAFAFPMGYPMFRQQSNGALFVNDGGENQVQAAQQPRLSPTDLNIPAHLIEPDLFLERAQILQPAVQAARALDAPLTSRPSWLDRIRALFSKANIPAPAQRQLAHPPAVNVPMAAQAAQPVPVPANDVSMAVPAANMADFEMALPSRQLNSPTDQNIPAHIIELMDARRALAAQDFNNFVQVSNRHTTHFVEGVRPAFH